MVKYVTYQDNLSLSTVDEDVHLSVLVVEEKKC